MKTIKFLTAIALSICAIFVFVSSIKPTDASVTYGNDYKSLEVTSTNASTTPIVVKAGTGSLGSIIIASTTSAAVFAVYDNAVSTSSATSTRIALFPKSAVAGVYTFDVEIKRGIVLDVVPAFQGSYIVTYR